MSRPERHVAWATAAKAGDRDAASKLLQDTDRLCWKYVRKYGAGLDTDDLKDMRAEVDLKLLESAIPKFDSSRAGWVTYAAWQIQAVCVRWIEKSGAVRTPSHLRRAQRRFEKYRALAASAGLEVGDDRICDVLGISPEQVSRVQETTAFVSFDAPFDEDSERTLHDVVASAPEEVDDVPRLLEAISEILDPRLRQIMQGRAEGKTLVEIGLEVGVSRERVRQIEASGLAILRHKLGVERVDELCRLLSNNG